MEAGNGLKINISLNEKDVIKLILEFLSNRELNISSLDIERETGVINGTHSDDILFLRQLILDGQWDDAIEFVQPLKQIDTFNIKQFTYIVMKYQYLELLCLKAEANAVDNQLSVDQLVTYLNDLRPYCPSVDDYKRLCLLLTSSKLQEHAEFKNWNPSSGRLTCFKDILPLVTKYLNGANDNSAKHVSNNERLVQLIVKGLLYESCVEYCQARATSSIETYNLNDPNQVLMTSQLSETDASLLSWLHALPIETFSCPFEEKSLNLNMMRFLKPNLEAQWADSILATPIKPQLLFPYNAVPTGRSRNTELMSRSLAPQYDGLSFGLSRSQIFTSGTEMKLNNNSNNMNDQTLNRNSTKHHVYQRDLNDLTRSIALFNVELPVNDLNHQVAQQQQLQQQLQQPIAKGSNLNTSYIGRLGLHMSTLNGIEEEEPNEAKKEEDEIMRQRQSYNAMSDSTLFREYQKNKAQMREHLEEREKKRDELINQLKCNGNILKYMFF